ncbi:hypothetical protein [Clostridium sp. Marseille-Q2269]|nr:hypothetical protein [Clostridium sp. Marseille-Q2269]
MVVSKKRKIQASMIENGVIVIDLNNDLDLKIDNNKVIVFKKNNTAQEM